MWKRTVALMMSSWLSQEQQQQQKTENHKNGGCGSVITNPTASSQIPTLAFDWLNLTLTPPNPKP